MLRKSQSQQWSLHMGYNAKNGLDISVCYLVSIMNDVAEEAIYFWQKYRSSFMYFYQ